MAEEAEEEVMTEERNWVAVNASDDDDDEEANEDLSLKILEKALSRRAVNATQSDVSVFDDSTESSMVDLCTLRERETCVVASLNEEKETGKVEDGTLAEQSVGVKESGDLLDHTPIEMSNNVVLRKLLRGPRYFDPPESNWETCYNCGEGGHMAVNCPSATKRKKPCFVCGSLEHNARQCPKALDCFICKMGGHRAKDCPDKFKSGSKISNICLRCGATGHDMFSCKNNYSEDDLKEIQCYICRKFGHLCCVNFVDSSPSVASCYRCGQLGHSGSACSGEATGKASPSSCYRCGEGGHFARECTSYSRISYKQGKDSLSSCYKCGEEGHFARECASSSKAPKRNREWSTPSNKPQKKYKSNFGYKSAPPKPEKPREKRARTEEMSAKTTQKLKQKFGRIVEDARDFSERNNHRLRGKKSLSTPFKERHQVSSLTSGGSFPSPRSHKMAPRHRYSASRFGSRAKDHDQGIPFYDRW